MAFKKRRRLSRKASRKSFRKGAVKTHKRNVLSRIMRGGYRI